MGPAMHVGQVHSLDLKLVSTPKHRSNTPKRVFSLWLRTAMQPTAKGEVEQPIPRV